MNENLEQYIKFKKGEIRMPAHLKPRKELSGKLYESARAIGFKNIVIPDKRNEVESDQPAYRSRQGISSMMLISIYKV